jgi:hypothetical protein
MRTYILERAKEPSTWRGILLFLTAIGVPIAPELANNIVTVGLGLAGIVGMVTKG